MKTALFTFTYLTGRDVSATSRLTRAQNFISFYENIKAQLGFEHIFISDNGSDVIDREKLLGTIKTPTTMIKNYLMDRGGGIDYLPCWRQQYDLIKAIEAGYEKIIAIDDDGFLLSPRIIRHVKNIKSGWETFWCPKYQFPEAAISILCKDAFPIYLDFIKTPYEQRNKTGCMELIMPYTKVNKDFNTDRYGESYAPQLPEMDGYFQCPGSINLKARK